MPDTGDTVETRLLKTSETQRIRNAFQYRKKKYFNNEPELSSYLTYLESKCTKGSKPLSEFKRLVGECLEGNFDTPELNLIKTRVRLGQTGAALGSLEKAIETNSHSVVVNAIKNGTIPYVLKVILETEQVHWPEAYDFVTDSSYWMADWRKNPIYNPTYKHEVECMETCLQISDWLYDNDPSSSLDHTCRGESCARGSASTGDVVMVARASAATARHPNVHDDSNCPCYEELHKRVWKQMQKVTARWPKAKTTTNLCIDRALTQHCEDHEPAVDQFVKLRNILNDGNSMYNVLECVRAEVMILGKKFHSKDRLLECSGICANLRHIFREIAIGVRALRQAKQVSLDSS